ncbi:MAG: fibronectin type III domain-containing protein [Ignavibacteriales bacterium]|nr:fibronectin type III domain-containing protein [Ignavibacteriales bacterium]
MKKLILFLLMMAMQIIAQTNVFTDNFNTSQGATFFTSGKIGSSNWDINRSGADFGARINNNILELTNDATSTANANGWIFVNQPLSNVNSPFNATLSSNSGLVTWSFNMRQIRTDPAGFTSGSYGVAFILGSTSQNVQTTGTGYAILLGQSGSTDPIRLAKFSAGLQTSTNLITSNTSGLTDFGTEYLSVIVTYDPSNNTWELFLRNDGSSSFSDPLSGTLTSQGTIVDNTYTGSALSYFGAYWQGSTTASQTAFFDNINISVNTISVPSSPVATSATNILQTSFTANWNASVGATKYFIDVAIDSTFTTFVTGYQNKELGNVTNENVTGLTANTNYYYRVRANNTAGTSVNSNVINVTTLPNPPAAPISTAATNISQTGFTANWESSLTATKYYLDVATDNAFTSFVSGYENKDVGNNLTADVSGLNPNTNYYYRVRSENSGGVSGNSNIISLTTLPSSLDAPVATAATSITQTSFTANWNAVAGANKYFLDVSTVNDFSSYITGYENKDVGNLTTENLTGLNANTIYYYRVRANNGSVTSGNSNVIDVTTLPNIPDAPVATAATNVTQTSFTANWNASSSATKYFIDIATENTFTNFLSGYQDKELGNVTSENVTGLNANAQYFYRIRANNVSGTSGNSNVIDVTTLPNAPAAPNANSATNISSTGFTANWDASTGATKYYLDVATDNTFTTFVTGFQNKDVGNNLNANVTGLNPTTNYFYRVRGENSGGVSSNSNVISVTTSAASTAGIIVNEWSQGASGAKEWVELLVVEDNLNIQGYKLIDGNGSLSLTLSGSGFQSIRKGTLIVLYNGGDVDGLITSDLTYDGTTDKNLVISSLNNTGTWSITRTTGWNSTTGAFSNSTNTDVPTIQNNSGTTIFTTPKFAGSNQIAYFTEDTETEATIVGNWNTSSSSNGTPGQPNGGNNTAWITTTLSTSTSTIPDAPIAQNASSITSSSFTANWNVSSGATKYYLDVATDNAFTSFVSGYENKDVGNSTSLNITGLNPSTNYFYRVRANNSLGTSGNSNVIQVTTLTNQTSVQFASTSGSVYENAGSYNLTFSINNPSATTPTTFEVAVTGGTGNLADINNYTTQTVTFPAGSSSDKTLQININNDGVAEGNETIIFTIQNVSGGNSAIVGTNSSLTLTISDPITDYYSGVNTTLNGSAFKTELHNLIKGHTAYPYSSSSTDIWDILMDAYEDPANPSNVILIYTGRSQAKTYNSSTYSNDQDAWNREHIFAQSRGGFDVNNPSQNPGVASDAHNLAPADASVNSLRSNKDFDIGGSPIAEAPGCFTDADSFEPRDAVKGDIARILFYMDTRYEGDNGEPQLELYDGVNTPVGTIGKLSTLLLWHQQDPPDAFEIARNNKIYNYQHNKNPFIDHPEWVAKIYGSNAAPTISNISRNIVVPDENQNLTVSANIIDDVSVSNAQLLYSINGGAQQFVNMTLTSGSLYSATIPETAYTNGDLLEYKIKAVDNESNERLSESYKVFTGITPISTLHQVDANGILLYNGIYSKVRGIATVPNGLFSSTNLEVNLQDNTGGIVVYKVTAGATPFLSGNNYTVSGSLTQYNGLAELVPDNVSTDIVNNGNDVEVQPVVKTFAELFANPEQYEGMLIKVKNVNKISGTWAASQNLTVNDGTSSDITIRISSGTNLASNPEPTWPKDVVGVFTQFDNSSPFNSGYQLKPRSISDIQNTTSPSQATKYIVTASNNNPAAGSTITINAQLSDNSGNPISTAGKVVTWSSSNGGSFSSATSVTNSSGIATVNFIVSTQAGVSHVITASDDSTPSLTGNSSNITTVSGVAAGFIVTVSDENPVAGSQISVNAQLVDIYNNHVNSNGVFVNWSSTNGGSFLSATSSTNSNGVATVNFTTSTQTGIIHTIKATIGTAPNQIVGFSNQILTKSGAPAKYIVTLSNNTPIVNTEIFASAQLVDQNNNPVALAGKVVNWFSSNGGSFSQASSITNAQGKIDVTFTVSTKANVEHIVSVSDNDGLSGSSNVVITKAGQPKKFLLSVSDLTPFAGSEINVDCQLVDEFENPTSQNGMSVKWSSTNGGIILNETTLLNPDGFVANKFKVDSKAGIEHIINVVAVNNSNIVGASQKIVTKAGVGKKYILTLSNNKPFVGTSISITAQLVDDYNNNVMSEGNTLNWSSTNGGSFSNVTTITDANGKSTNVFTTANVAGTKHIISLNDQVERKGTSEEIITNAIDIPKLISPTDNLKNVPLENNFSWSLVQNVDGYEIIISKDQNFQSIFFNKTLNDNSIKISSLELGNKYYWKVRAIKEKGFSDWSTVWSFATLPLKPNTPNLLSPTNSSINQKVITTLKWQKIENADYYNLQISDDDKFSKVIFEKNEIVDAQIVTTKLDYNHKYFWRVKAYNLTGSSNISEVWSYSTIDTIIAPSKLVGYIDVNSNVVLNWKDNSNNENGFKLERHDPGGMDYYQFDEVASNTTSYTVSGLEAGKKYLFRMKAFNNSTVSDYSNIIEVLIPNQELKAPSNLIAKVDEKGFINLFWNDNSNDESGFIIYRQDEQSLNIKENNKVIGSYFVPIDTVPANTNKYLDNKTEFGKKYSYQVIAYNQSGISKPTQLKNEIMPLKAPSKLVATLTNESVQLNWQDNSENETEFVIQRATKPNMEFQSIDKVGANVKSYLDSKVIDGKKYYYNVFAASNEIGVSANSNLDSAYLKMKAPTNLVVKQITNQNKIDLSWKDNSQSETGYKIERKEFGELNFVEIFTTLANSTNYSDATVSNKKNYIYRIKGFNEDGYSDYSNESSVLVGIDAEEKLPSNFNLSQNYPNPFNPSTVISYQLPMDGNVTLKVYDMLGNEIATLVNQFQRAGSYNYQFSINNLQLSSGVYYYRLQSGNFVQTKKFIVMK